VGDAAQDPDFTGKGSLVRYSANSRSIIGPLHIWADSGYEPIGFRWAHNLGSYQADEPQRMVSYYDFAGLRRSGDLGESGGNEIAPAKEPG